MKRMVALILLGTLGLPVAIASAQEPAKAVSRKGLASMGLGGMKQISSAEGTKVRGKGTFTYVSGSATAGGTTHVGVVHSFPGGVYQTSFAVGGGGFAYTSSTAIAH